ncbi:MAG: hypothetical protein MJ116_02750 [Lachnospiraceae bacterium]|nr:hypothetical protein [Lachnospiraceae bacterium]
MSDKERERILQMHDEEVRESIIRLNNVVDLLNPEVANNLRHFCDGFNKALMMLDIRPEEFSHGCKTSA